jgi:dienelactone hydrolase
MRRFYLLGSQTFSFLTSRHFRIVRGSLLLYIDLMEYFCMGVRVLSCWLLSALLLSAYAQDSSWQAALGDSRELAKELREEIVSIAQLPAKKSDKPPALVGTLYQPHGTGPFAVIVLSHGSPSRGADRILLGRYRLTAQISAMVNQGWAVLVPMRRGYGASPGDYAENIGFCHEPQYEKTGFESAQDLRAAVEFIRSRRSLDAKKIVLMGQSAGGFASIATGSLQLPGVVAVVNFSGGRGGNGFDGVPCRPDLMAQTIAAYANKLRAPVLWFYVENDKYFGPAVAKSWFAAFEAAGGKGTFVMHPTYGNDGHLLFYKTEAIPIWLGVMNDFFKEFGLLDLKPR